MSERAKENDWIWVRVWEVCMYVEGLNLHMYVGRSKIGKEEKRLDLDGYMICGR